MKNAKFTLERVCGYFRPVSNWNKGKKEEFKDRIKAMSLEEMELALDVIPVELCLARVNRELDRLKTFESSVKTAVNG